MKCSVVMAAGLALLLSGCGSSPKTRFYTLEAVPPATGAALAVASGRVLQVGHIDLPGTLDRAALVTVGPGPQVTVSDDERWAAPLDQLTRRTLTDDLRARLGASEVLAPGDPVPPGGVRRVVVVMQRFGADAGGTVVLEADWTLAAGNPPRAGTTHHVRITEHAGSTAGGPVASAMSQALGVLADNLCHDVGEAGTRRRRG